MQRERIFKVFLRVLSIVYGIGAGLHLADVLGLRWNFNDMNLVWKAWIIYILVGDTIAAIGLWQTRLYGEILFIFIAVSQLIAYLGFSDFFGDQGFLIAFHLVTLSIYGILKCRWLSR